MTLRSSRLAATVMLSVWLVTLALLFGPVRWSVAHAFEHAIEGAEGSLPRLTAVVTLPVLWIGPDTATALLVRTVSWGVAWLGPLALLAGVRRARSREDLADLLLYGGGLYAVLMALSAAVVLFGLWQPFGPVM